MPLSTQEYKWTLVGCQKNLTKCQDVGGGGGGENDCLTEFARLPAPRWKGEGVRALARDCGIVLWQVGRLGSSAALLVT